VLCAVSGLRKLVFGNLGYALGEFYRGIYKAAQVKALQKFVPSLKTSDVIKFVLLTYSIQLYYRVSGAWGTKTDDFFNPLKPIVASILCQTVLG